MPAATPSTLAQRRLEGELTIYRAAELKAELSALQGRADTLELDLSGITEIDTAGVQLLMALKRRAADLSRELRLAAHSPAVLEAFDLLGLAAFFGDALVEAPAVEAA